MQWSVLAGFTTTAWWNTHWCCHRYRIYWNQLYFRVQSQAVQSKCQRSGTKWRGNACDANCQPIPHDASLANADTLHSLRDAYFANDFSCAALGTICWKAGLQIWHCMTTYSFNLYFFFSSYTFSFVRFRIDNTLAVRVSSRLRSWNLKWHTIGCNKQQAITFVHNGLLCQIKYELRTT